MSLPVISSVNLDATDGRDQGSTTSLSSDVGTGALSGIGLPNVADFLKPIGPGSTQPLGTPASGQGAGPAPGPAIVNNGTIGMDPRALTQRVDAHNNQSWRKHMTSVRPS